MWPLPEDLREELQRELAEIRAEVTRCAAALQAPEALPSAEVLDIRQQLSELGAEVMKTSRALLEGGTSRSPSPPPTRSLPPHTTMAATCIAQDPGLLEVRSQLEALQQQVARAMSAAHARPLGLQELSAPPQALPAPGVSALHARLAALRAGVARALQDPPSPAQVAELGALLGELHEVRARAAAAAAALATSGGGGLDAQQQLAQHMQQQQQQQMQQQQEELLQQLQQLSQQQQQQHQWPQRYHDGWHSQLEAPAVHRRSSGSAPVPLVAEPLSAWPEAWWRSAEPGRCLDVGPLSGGGAGGGAGGSPYGAWGAGSRGSGGGPGAPWQLHRGAGAPVALPQQPQPPLFVCPHLAAGLGVSAPGTLLGGGGGHAVLLQQPLPPAQHAPPRSGASSGRSSPLSAAAAPAAGAPPDLGGASASVPQRRSGVASRPSSAGSWRQPLMDVPPGGWQGATGEGTMWRPFRTKIPGPSEAAGGHAPTSAPEHFLRQGLPK